MFHILVVEDDASISNLIRTTLQGEGYLCTCALDGKRGADLIDSGHWDLILLDLMLPEISGYDLLEYIRPTETPVIIISAMGQVQDRIRGLKMGRTTIWSSPSRSASWWPGWSPCSAGRGGRPGCSPAAT